MDVLFFFFFQAEDGIRDVAVTGVQTCALPILEIIPTGAINLDAAIGIGGIPRGRVTEIFGPESSGKTTLALHVVGNAQRAGGAAAYIDAERSEERRVGKECRSRWSPYH